MSCRAGPQGAYTVVAGEPLNLRLWVANPFRVPLRLDAVSPALEFEPAKDAKGLEEGALETPSGGGGEEETASAVFSAAGPWGCAPVVAATVPPLEWAPRFGARGGLEPRHSPVDLVVRPNRPG